MTDSVDNLVLEQLRLIREDIAAARTDIARVEETLTDQIAALEGKVDGITGVVVALGRYMHDMDERVERLEERIGGGT
ncbi:MAG: hypothetical protein JKP98_04605 [Rhodobacteraceae bacterium]|jgi:hypothetical protein|nr:hypothetical protein [Paracoccaceae bacterium]MBL4556721.1 hypothetical protein [Paracoccaceae bacterium]HBG98236.1 hypothetical protein [Paracoccaceae bacterium]